LRDQFRRAGRRVTGPIGVDPGGRRLPTGQTAGVDELLIELVTPVRALRDSFTGLIGTPTRPPAVGFAIAVLGCCSAARGVQALLDIIEYRST
jgi:hypothetical protein